MIRAILLSLALAAVAACSDNASTTSDSSKFIGKWTYQPGSAVVIDCPNAPEQSLDLSKVPPANQPAYFTFTAAPPLVHEVDARACVYDWTVSGNAATALANQSCATFPDGRGGNQLVHMQTGTKSTTDGVTMNVDVHFTNDAGCAIAVHGTATKS